MTGMNAARHRVTNWTLQPDQKQPMENNHPTLDFPDWNFNGMAVSKPISNAIYATPLPKLLQQKGYYTIHAGKGHFGAIGYPSANPINLGFDVNIAGHAAGAPGSYLGEENFGNGNEQRSVWAVPGLEKYHGKNIFLTEALTQEALLALKKPIFEKKPFFLYLSLYGVHTPLMADQRFFQKYIEKGIPMEEAKYASMIESMDSALGEVLNFIEKEKIEKNTVVLFMSDNGGLSAVARAGKKHTHNAPLKSGKGSIYEGGIRVPMLAYWPGVSTPKTKVEDPVIIEDFFNSILEITGGEKVTTIQEIDGHSFVPLLKGLPKKNRPLFWHYPNEWGLDGPGIGSFSAVRDGNWKLIFFHHDQHFELYNLIMDIGEANNLSLIEKERTKILSRILSTHLRLVGAQMPRDKKTKEQVLWPDEALSNRVKD